MLVFSLLVVILQFQIETAKCDGPESWAVGWVLYDRLGIIRDNSCFLPKKRGELHQDDIS